MLNNVLSDATAFRESFLSEASPTNADRDYGAVFRVLLFYLWRGCSLSRTSGITGKVNPNAALISLSAYEAILGILQNIRIGYQADATILARSLMERIAIVGYLGENRALIQRYWDGKWTPYKEALAWAKNKSLPNWMILYGALSGVVHSRLAGAAGHVNNQTKIGNVFREVEHQDSSNNVGIPEELLGFVVYSLMALDPLALALIQDNITQPFPTDPSFVAFVGINDAKEYRDFLQNLIKRYEKTPTNAP